MRLCVALVCILYSPTLSAAATTAVSAEEATATAAQPSVRKFPAMPAFVVALKGLVENILGSPSCPLARKLIAAKVSPDCSLGLANFVRAVRNMEPWAYRLIDATGKYPTGLFQGTLSDVGAFDECVETVVRDYYGQETVRAHYCNVYLDGNATDVLRYLKPAITMSHPRAIDFALESGNNRFVEGVRIGICFISDCRDSDIQSLLEALVEGALELNVKDCVTSLNPPMSKTQRAVVALLGVLAATICLSTGIDIYMTRVKAKRIFWRYSRIGMYLTYRLMTFALKNRLVPPEVLRLIAPFWPSVGHAEMMTKVLRSELWRQFDDVATPGGTVQLIEITCLSSSRNKCLIDPDNEVSYAPYIHYVNGFPVKIVTAFSVRANLEILFDVARDPDSDAYRYRFFHGLRFFSMFMVVIGHSYNIFDFINTSRMVNALHYADDISFSFIMTGYLSVDVFFFLSGFLLALNIEPKPHNRLLMGLIAIVRRHIRTTAPVFFAMTSCLLVPQVVSGPNLKALMEKFYYEFRNQWAHILLQIRNLYCETEIGMFGHLWFISADFQLFLVALPTILILKRYYWPLIAVFVSLSLLCCSVTAWQVFNTPYPPFMTPVVADIGILLDTLNIVYVLPFYHAMCYFSGCVTYLLLKKYRRTKISKVKQVGMWCLALTCALTTLFLKYDWNRGRGPTGQWLKIPLVFIDRIMWSFCVGWTVFACSTRRGGALRRFFSWSAFVPLSRLCFGIYIVHVPFFFIKSNVARERIFYSHFSLVLQTFGIFVASSLLSFVMYLACEAPVGRLEKLFLMPTHKDGKTQFNCPGRQIKMLRQLPSTLSDVQSANTQERKETAKDYSSRL